MVSRFGFLFFLLVLAIIESVVLVHLSMIAILILAVFVNFTSLIWWAFLTGLVLDLLTGSLLGVNSLILVSVVSTLYFVKNLFWPNFSYFTFPKQMIAITTLQVIFASRFYDFFNNFVNFGIVAFDFNLKSLPLEIILTLALFPAISFLSLYWVPQKQMGLKF